MSCNPPLDRVRALAESFDRAGDRLACVCGCVAALLLAPACHADPGVLCACAAEGVTVRVTPSTGGETAEVVPSGPACTGAAVTCESSGDAATCSLFRVVPVGAGECHLDVLFGGGGTDDSADVTIAQTTGCCAGFYADPPSAGDVELPSPGSSSPPPAAAEGGADA